MRRRAARRASNLPAVQGSSQSAVPAAVNDSVASLGTARTVGGGAAYQAVAQTTALTVQDATDYLRNITVIGATTVGVASAEMIAQQQPDPWTQIIETAQNAVDTAAASFLTIGTDAATVLANYRSSL